MIRILLLLAALALCPAARAQPSEADKAAVAAQLQTLFDLARGDRFREALAGVDAVRKAAEDTRDFRLLEELYDLMGIAAGKTGNRTLEVRGYFQNALLRTRSYGALSPLTVSSDIGLAITYDNRKFDTPMQIVAANGIGTIRILRETGKMPDNLLEEECWAHTLNANSYLREKRPELALHHGGIVRRLGAGCKFSDSETDTLAAIIRNAEKALADEAVAGAPVLPAAADCAATRKPEAPVIALCIRLADKAVLDGDVARALALLAEMATDAAPDRVPDARLAPLLARHLLLVETLPPDAPEVIHSTDLVGNKLAVREFGSAALLSMRTIIAVLETGSFNQRLADLAGHIARRAARGGDEDVALRFLDVQAVMFRHGIDKADKEGDEMVARAFERALIVLDAASFAGMNGYEKLAGTYMVTGQRSIEVLALLPMAKLRDRAMSYWNKERGYVFPGAGAAAELVGRIAARAPAEPGNDQDILIWLSSEAVWRGNEQGARKLAEELIGSIRQSGGPRRLLGDLLRIQAGYVAEPQLSNRLSREALAVFREVQGTEVRQIETLFDLANDSRISGDYETALRLVEEADRLVQSAGDATPFHRSIVAKWRSDAAFREGDLAGATAAAEQSLDLVVEATRPYDYRRVAPAMTLAELYGHAGRMDEARALRSAHVSADAINPLLVGESGAIASRLRFVLIEAFFAPTPASLTEISQIRGLIGRAASRDDDLQRSINRAEAFAQYGLGKAMPALVAGRRALAQSKARSTELSSVNEDRPLLETLVGAAVLAAGGTPP